MKHLLVFFIALSVLFTAGAMSEDKPSPAPGFSLKTADGKSVELKNLKGKVVVVNFWATWCPPCRAEIPGMIEVYNSYKAKGLEIVAVSLDRGGWKDVTPFAEKMGMKFPVVLDQEGELATAYGGIQYIPTTFIIDRKGNIVSKHVGGISKSDFEKAVQKAL